MASPITIRKNDELLFEAKNIQEAARFLSEHLNITKSKCFDYIERGYVYNITYDIKGDEYSFIAPAEIALNRRKELEDRGHHNARRVWLIPANPEEYDVVGAFSEYEVIDWRRSGNFENGDILFIYVSKGIHKVRFKVEVIEGLVKDNVFDYDTKYWKDNSKLEQMKISDYTRVRLIDMVDTDELSFKNLRENGLNSKIQGPEKINGELRDYIMPFFQMDLTDGYYPEEVTRILEEGKSKTIEVNRYERNHLARRECVEYYGVECQICEMYFEDIYGEVGKDFIHVHHIIPLSEIKQGYVVNPKQDLIPVCPNCHAMLHRKENGSYLSIEQLKERISNKKSIMV